ncbi:hypothetical protein [Halorubrum ezzemoulense]|uniref:Uncharacterized protein n=1 Tax=Halorubrum ezzemoulense TaxID=337243 RepID=A0A256JGX3_HALEZ|nr:hypothetical protein [Halorubrum ezzemoulense]OYR68125.1 hypothetical protein DJ78_14385 [Halorubrum ezzemoulense]
MSSTRRALLATSGLIATAGCVRPIFGPAHDKIGSLSLRAQTPSTVAERTTTPVTVRALGPYGHTLVRRVLDDGSASYTAADTLVAEGEIVQQDGAFYELTHETTGHTPAMAYPIEFEATVPATTSVDDDETVSFDALPAVDRSALRTGLINELWRRLSRTEGRVSGDGELVYPATPSGPTESLVAPTPEYDTVRYGDGQLRLSVTGEVTETRLHSYRLEGSTVATSEEAYVSDVLTRSRTDAVKLEASTLTDRQHDILQAAIDQEYGHDQPIDDASSAYRTLVVRLFASDSDRESVDLVDLSGSEAMVVYDGTLYRASYTVSTP